MSDKKFYLNHAERDFIVSALYDKKDVFEKEIKEAEPKGQVLEICEAGLQRVIQLIELLKLTDSEKGY